MESIRRSIASRNSRIQDRPDGLRKQATRVRTIRNETRSKSSIETEQGMLKGSGKPWGDLGESRAGQSGSGKKAKPRSEPTLFGTRRETRQESKNGPSDRASPVDGTRHTTGPPGALRLERLGRRFELESPRPFAPSEVSPNTHSLPFLLSGFEC